MYCSRRDGSLSSQSLDLSSGKKTSLRCILLVACFELVGFQGSADVRCHLHSSQHSEMKHFLALMLFILVSSCIGMRLHPEDKYMAGNPPKFCSASPPSSYINFFPRFFSFPYFLATFAKSNHLPISCPSNSLAYCQLSSRFDSIHPIKST
jgi:hypothetical protein